MATQTTNYGLTIFEPDDKPTWQGDWNENMDKIDTAIHEAAQSGGGGTPIEIAQTTGSSTTAVMSQNATTVALGDKVNTSAIVQEIDTTTPSATNIPSEAAVAAALGGGGVEVINTLTTPVSMTGVNYELTESIQNVNESIYLVNVNFTEVGSTSTAEIGYIKTDTSQTNTQLTAQVSAVNKKHTLTGIVIVPANTTHKLIFQIANEQSNVINSMTVIRLQ